MFNPKDLDEDLRAEVDHSFFDSDAEAGPLIKVQDETVGFGDGDGKTEAKKREDASKEDVGTGSLEHGLSRLQIPSWNPRERDEASSDEERRKTGVEEDGWREHKDGREDSDASSSRSSLIPSSERSESGSSSSQLGDSSSVHSYSSTDSRSDLLWEEKEDGEDGVAVDGVGYQWSKQDGGSNEKEKPQEKTQRGNTKKVRNQRRWSSSKLDSSDSGGERNPDPVTPTTASPRRRSRQGSANRRSNEAADSDTDTVTDVTPLSTPDVSPGQSFDLATPTEPLETVTERPQQDAVKKERDEEEERQSAPSSSRRVGSGSVVVSSPVSMSSVACSGRARKNFTFSNDEVRRIERENRRLMKVLSRPSSALTNANASASANPHRDTQTLVRPNHSALNRQREQERIVRENLAFLKRLESVKPTPGMTRSEQLADYQRQAGYLGMHNSLITPLSGKGSRPCSSISPNRTKPKNVKPSRATAPRPAWS